MKIRVTMKDPDSLYDAVRDAVQEEVEKMNLDSEETEALVEIRADKVNNMTGRWFNYGEYLTVEIDTEANTCTVVPNY